MSEDIRQSPSYPGIDSVYRVHIIPCEILVEELDEGRLVTSSGTKILVEELDEGRLLLVLGLRAES